MSDRKWTQRNDKGYSRPTARSRELRMNATEAEPRLWQALRAQKLAGVRFNRQFPIGQFICDFVSRERKLIIEIDGGQHANNRNYDERRARFLEGQGYRVIRFWNSEVLDNIDGVLTMIELTLRNMPSPNSSRKREGGLWNPRASGGRS